MKLIERVVRNIIVDVKFCNKTTDEAVEMLTDMVEKLSSKNTTNKPSLDDSLQDKLIEHADNQEGLSSKKDRELTDDWIELYAIENILEDDSIMSHLETRGWIDGAIWMRDLVQERRSK